MSPTIEKKRNITRGITLIEPVTQTQPPYNLPRLDRDDDIPFSQPPRPPLHRQNNNQNDTVDDNQQMHQPANSQSLLPSIWEEAAPHQGEENLPQPRHNPL